MQTLTPTQRDAVELESLALEQSIARHPAGKRRVQADLHRCPTCGQRPSGALGDPALSL